MLGNGVLEENWSRILLPKPKPWWITFLRTMPGKRISRRAREERNGHDGVSAWKLDSRYIYIQLWDICGISPTDLHSSVFTGCFQQTRVQQLPCPVSSTRWRVSRVKYREQVTGAIEEDGEVQQDTRARILLEVERVPPRGGSSLWAVVARSDIRATLE